MTAFDLAPGTIFGEDFKVVSPLSRGGMGAVYVVEQVSTQKRRALKLMLAARASDPEMRKRFEQEAKVGAMIPSEHVVDVIAAGIDAKSQIPWLAMELLDGEDLESFSERRGTVTPAELDEIFSQLCHALAAAHAIPIVHRDLKPGNIFLARPRLSDARPIVKVLDFGIAKIVGAAPSTTAALGTPLWMAPEQSEPRAPVTPAADVWALGLIAFRLLTGRLYWVSANDPDKPALSVVREVLFEPLVSASERARGYGVVNTLPPRFDEWFDRCVTRDLTKRFAEAGAAWRALHEVLAPGRGPQASNPGISDVRNSSVDARRHAVGIASTMMATPAPTTGQKSGASATLDAVGQTLAREREGTQRAESRGRFVVFAAIALIAVLAIGGGAVVLLRDPVRSPASAAASTPPPPASTAASSAAPVATPSASVATVAPQASATPSATASTKPPSLHGTVPPRPGMTGKAPDPTVPTQAPPPPPPRPTATTPFLL